MRDEYQPPTPAEWILLFGIIAIFAAAIISKH